MVKLSSRPRLGELIPIPTPDLPLELMALDTIVMGTAARSTKQKYIQLIIDHHSRHIWAYATPTNTGECIVNILTQLFRSIGHPRRIITDRHKNYRNNQLKRLLNNAPNRIIHSFTSSYHPQTNGLCEKANGTIITKLRIAMNEHPKRKWTTLLPNIVTQYNETIHDSTGFTPKFLFFGNISGDTSLPTIEAARAAAKERSDSLKLRWKQHYDSHHTPELFQPNDLVKKRIPLNRPDLNKLTQRYEGPYRVIERTSDTTYRIALPNTEPINVNIEQLERYYARTECARTFVLNVGGMTHRKECDTIEYRIQ
jgi:transposase InsO family protein